MRRAIRATLAFNLFATLINALLAGANIWAGNTLLAVTCMTVALGSAGGAAILIIILKHQPRSK